MGKAPPKQIESCRSRQHTTRTFFNTMWTKDHNVQKIHFHTCTGYSRLIMKSVWNHPETERIVESVMRTHRKFCASAGPGAVFDVVIYCTSGCHRSVAVALLLEQLFPCVPLAYQDMDNKVSVQIKHRSQESGLWKQNRYCGQKCTNCKESAFKSHWMKTEMVKVAEKIGNSIFQ